MSSCCQPDDYDKVFDEKFARSKAREYARNGLTRDAQRIVAFARAKLPPGYSVLEVGGGVGALQLELLKSGAARALNVELATRYETVASELIKERDLGDRVERRLGDFVREAATIPEADIVVLDRVVCCYPHVDAHVGAAAEHARRFLFLIFPVDRWWIRAALALERVWFAIRGNSFRAYGHATSAVLSAAQHHGMRPVDRHRGIVWQLIALERTG